jgi:hypothetical protein
VPEEIPSTKSQIPNNIPCLPAGRNDQTPKKENEKMFWSFGHWNFGFL